MEKMTAIEKDAYAVGLKVGSWHPGDGVTRYRFFRETANDYDADYFGGSHALATVLGRKAANAFIEAYRHGRNAGLREASAEVTNAATASHGTRGDGDALTDAKLRIDRLREHGPWHFGRPVSEEEAAILASGGRI